MIKTCIFFFLVSSTGFLPMTMSCSYQQLLILVMLYSEVAFVVIFSIAYLVNTLSFKHLI